MTAAHRRDPAEQARLDAALKDLFEQRITFNQVLGLRVESTRLADVRLGFEMRPELIGHFTHHRLHGGVISATLDAIGGLAVMAAIGAGRVVFAGPVAGVIWVTVLHPDGLRSSVGPMATLAVGRGRGTSSGSSMASMSGRPRRW